MEEQYQKQLLDYLESKGVKNLKELEQLFELPLFSVIPSNVLTNIKLSPAARIIFATILALTKKSGYCFATNSYLAESTGLSEKTVIRKIKELKKHRFISVDIERNQDGTFREIRVCQIGGKGVIQVGVEGVAQNGGDKRYINNNNNIKYNASVKTDSVSLPKNEPIRKANPLFELMVWGEERRGRQFVNRGKQLKSIKALEIAGYGPEAIKDRWEEMENQRFWQENGFDFANIANSFNKKI